MLEHEGRWAYSINHETFDCETYSTKEEAIAAGTKDAEECGYSEIWVGECDYFTPWIDSDDVLDTLRDNAWTECDEAADGWLDNVTAKESERLETMLNDALHEWLRQTKNIPDFFTAEFAERIEVANG